MAEKVRNNRRKLRNLKENMKKKGNSHVQTHARKGGNDALNKTADSWMSPIFFLFLGNTSKGISVVKCLVCEIS